MKKPPANFDCEAFRQWVHASVMADLARQRRAMILAECRAVQVAWELDPDLCLS
jgi:hypothetical protein